MKQDNVSVAEFITRACREIRAGTDEAHQAFKENWKEQGFSSGLGNFTSFTIWLDASGKVAKTRSEAVVEARFSARV